jgi:hypothetical protein
MKAGRQIQTIFTVRHSRACPIFAPPEILVPKKSEPEIFQSTVFAPPQILGQKKSQSEADI